MIPSHIKFQEISDKFPDSFIASVNKTFNDWIPLKVYYDMPVPKYSQRQALQLTPEWENDRVIAFYLWAKESKILPRLFDYGGKKENNIGMRINLDVGEIYITPNGFESIGEIRTGSSLRMKPTKHVPNEEYVESYLSYLNSTYGSFKKNIQNLNKEIEEFIVASKVIKIPDRFVEIMNQRIQEKSSINSVDKMKLTDISLSVMNSIKLAKGEYDSVRF